MFKKSIVKFGSLIASLALTLTVLSGGASSCCFFIFHQPKEPEGMKKYKK